jgi:transcription termination factor Rho
MPPIKYALGSCGILPSVPCHWKSIGPAVGAGGGIGTRKMKENNAVEGVLEILPDGFGFLRRLENSYQSDPDDVHVARSLIRQFGIREGSLVRGTAIPPQKKRKSRQLSEIQAIDGNDPESYAKLPHFSRLTSIDPVERLRIEDSNDLSMRVIDLVAPIGKGQRGLIVASPRTGKTMLLQKLAQSISRIHPEVHLMVVLIDERPEEVTEMRRLTQAEVVSSSSDEMARRHVKVAEIVLERARRLVETGSDVVLLLDSITRLARAYNVESRGSGRTLSGGLGAGSMLKPREFFGAARKLEEGGSLTIIATALVDTGSRMDQVIFEEFKGTGNMELVLDRGLADRRIWPAVDISASGTRKEEKLRDPETQQRINLLRRALSDLGVERAMQTLLSKLEASQSNRHFLSAIRTS